MDSKNPFTMPLPKEGLATPTSVGKDTPTVLQVLRPFFTLKELSYLHSQTVPEAKKLAYSQRKHQVFQLLFQIVRTMKFPLRVLSTAMNYYQRYYLFIPFEEPKDMNPDSDAVSEYEKDPFLVAYTVLFLATKHEDCIKKLKELQSVANKLRDIDQELRSYLKTGASMPPLHEMQRKVIMSLEFKLLQVLKFDFINGAPNVPSVDYLVVSFAKELGLDYNLLLFAWLVLFDISQTPLCLVIPPHCIAMAIVIVSLNLRPKVINAKFTPTAEGRPIDEIWDNFNCQRDFRCPERLVNEGIVYILDYYVHQMNFSILNEYLPAVDADLGKEQIFKFMDLKSQFNDLDVLSEESVGTMQLLKQDSYLRKWDFSVGHKGSARFMIGNKRRRFDAEFRALRPPRDAPKTSPKQ